MLATPLISMRPSPIRRGTTAAAISARDRFMVSMYSSRRQEEKSGTAYGTVQVFAFWHIRKLPPPVQSELPASVHDPWTTPLLRVPVVVVVPFEVPVRFPESVSVLPAGVNELTVNVNGPLTCPVPVLVEMVTVPVSCSVLMPF